MKRVELPPRPSAEDVKLRAVAKASLRAEAPAKAANVAVATCSRCKTQSPLPLADLMRLTDDRLRWTARRGESLGQAIPVCGRCSAALRLAATPAPGAPEPPKASASPPSPKATPILPKEPSELQGTPGDRAEADVLAGIAEELEGLADHVRGVVQTIAGYFRFMAARRGYPNGFAAKLAAERNAEPPIATLVSAPPMSPPFVPMPEPAASKGTARRSRGDSAELTNVCLRCKGKTHPSAHAVGKHDSRCKPSTERERAFYATRGRWPRKDED